MITTVLGQVTGQLDKRFLLNAFLPALLFVLLCSLVVAAGTVSVATAIEWWEKAGGSIQVLAVIGVVSLVLAFASLLANTALGIVQLFEGWLLPAPLAAWGRRRQHHLAKKAFDADPSGFQMLYPVHPRQLGRGDLAPTQLGNLLRSAESYAQDRYGVDAVRIWPRLYHVIDDEMTTSMNEARSSMEFMLTLAFLSAMYSVLGPVVAITTMAPVTWFILPLVGGQLVAYCTYLGALGPAAAYGDHVRAAFDLHRLKLLAELKIPRPQTVDSERRTWAHVLTVLDDGAQSTWLYVSDDA